MLRALLLFRRRVRPDWSDERFIEAIARRSGSFAACRRDHPGATPREVIARFFRGRRSPEFFAAPGELLAMTRTVRRERAAWMERTVRLVQEECQGGLRLYARTGPPLGAAFPWRGLAPGPGGDKLYQKRPHRFAFAPRLALAALYGEPSDATLEGVVAGWMVVADSRANAMAYDSNLGVIQRLLALSWAWAFLAARENPARAQLEQEGLILKVIRSDIAHLLPRLGDSAANNHLLADLFAGWFIGCVWPELAPGEGLRERFEPLWLRELSRQTLADGTSFEHSTHYHEYACEMAVAYVLLSRRNGHAVPEWVLDRTSRMLEFQATLAGPEGATLAVGDAAEDPLFPLDSGDGWGTAAWREVHRALWPARLGPSSQDSPSAERAFWLLGGALAADTTAPPPSLVAYPSGGFYVFHDAPARARLVFRTGPVEGEPVSAGHAHSDLLSVCAAARGRLLVVDAGTYTYRARRSGPSRSDPDWRRYLAGAAAHNGLSLGGRDALGDVPGSFRRPGLDTFVAVSRVRDEPVASWVDAVVVGQGPYASHRRGVVQIPGEYFVVYDVLPSGGPARRREFGFQFSPHVEARPAGGRGIVVRDGAATLLLAGSSNLAPPICLRGSLEPVGGWVSPRYGELAAAPQARFAVSPEATAAAFLLRHAEGPAEVQVDVRGLDRASIRIRVSCGETEDTLLLNIGPAATDVEVDGIAFRGGLAWVRCHRGAPVALRWVDGSVLTWPARGISVERREPCPSLEIAASPIGPSVRFGGGARLSVQW